MKTLYVNHECGNDGKSVGIACSHLQAAEIIKRNKAVDVGSVDWAGVSVTTFHFMRLFYQAYPKAYFVNMEGIVRERYDTIKNEKPGEFIYVRNVER